MERIEKAHVKGNKITKELLLSYSKAEFFTNLPDIPEEIEVVTYVAVLVIFQQIFSLVLTYILGQRRTSDSQYLIIIKMQKIYLNYKVNSNKKYY